MHSTYNEGKPVIRTVKSKIDKYMVLISKTAYTYKLDETINKYNKTYHKTIIVKPVDVKDNTFISFGKEVNDKGIKFQVGDHVRVSKCKYIFAKGYTPNSSEDVFIIKTVKNTAPWTYVISDLNGEEVVESFYEKEPKKKKNQKQFRIEKVIKRKGNKLYVEWKGYDNSFNS